jgi:hypothetical protein
MESILQTIKRTDIVKEFSMKKIIDDKNVLATFKKHSNFKKCGILKL